MSDSTSSTVSAVPAAAVPSNWKRHLHALLILNVLSHVQNAGGRFAVVLFALHQQASPLMVGVLMGMYSLVPAVTSVVIGRYLDRSRDMRMPLALSGLVTCAGSLLPFFWESLVSLFICSMLVGGAFNICRIGNQQMTGRYGAAADRPASYAFYAQVLAVGNFAAPLIGGFAIDHVGFRYAFLVLAAMSLPMAFTILSGRLYLPVSDVTPAAQAEAARSNGGIMGLLRLRQVRLVLIAGVALMSVWDMFVFAWPLYGSELKFSASQIGIIAAIFYSGTFVVRAAAPRLLRLYSQWQLLLSAMLISSVMFLGFPFLSHPVGLGLLSFILGLVLGIIQPMTMSLIYEESPPERRGEAIGLRLTITFIVHIAIPLAAGAFASVLGIGSIWVMSAATLLLGVAWTRGQWNYRRAPQA